MKSIRSLYKFLMKSHLLVMFGAMLVIAVFYLQSTDIYERNNQLKQIPENLQEVDGMTIEQYMAYCFEVDEKIWNNNYPRIGFSVEMDGLGTVCVEIPIWEDFQSNEFSGEECLKQLQEKQQAGETLVAKVSDTKKEIELVPEKMAGVLEYQTEVIYTDDRGSQEEIIISGVFSKDGKMHLSDNYKAYVKSEAYDYLLPNMLSAALFIAIFFAYYLSAAWNNGKYSDLIGTLPVKKEQVYLAQWLYVVGLYVAMSLICVLLFTVEIAGDIHLWTDCYPALLALMVMQLEILTIAFVAINLLANSAKVGVLIAMLLFVLPNNTDLYIMTARYLPGDGLRFHWQDNYLCFYNTPYSVNEYEWQEWLQASGAWNLSYVQNYIINTVVCLMITMAVLLIGRTLYKKKDYAKTKGVWIKPMPAWLVYVSAIGVITQWVFRAIYTLKNNSMLFSEDGGVFAFLVNTFTTSNHNLYYAVEQTYYSWNFEELVYSGAKAYGEGAIVLVVGVILGIVVGKLILKSRENKTGVKILSQNF